MSHAARRVRAAIVLVALSVLAIAIVGMRPDTQAHVTALLLLASMGHAVLLTQPIPFAARTKRRLALVLASALAFSLVLALPVLSDDVYRYVWDGRVLRAGISPYAYAPSSPALAFLRDDDFRHINFPGIATIYPPFAQLLFVLGAGFGIYGAKVLGALAHVAITCVLALPRGPRAARAALIYGTCPVALVESSMSGHVDVFAGLFVLLTALHVARSHTGKALVAALLAAGTKLVGLLALPVLARRSYAAAAALVIATAMMIVPLTGSGGDGRAGIAHFTRRWSGNVVVYPVVETLTAAALERAFGTTHGRVRLPLEGWLGPYVRGTPLDIRETLLGPKKAAAETRDLHARTAARVVARALVVLVFLVVAAWIVRRRASPESTLRDLLRALLVLSPQIHPWYVLWILPLEASTGRIAGFVLATGLVATYASLPAWIAHRVWIEPTACVAIAHVAFFVCLAIEARALSPSCDRVRAATSAPR